MADIEIDCYDLKECPGECPEGGWEECSANPDAGMSEIERRFGCRLRALGLAILAVPLLLVLLAAARCGR